MPIPVICGCTAKLKVADGLLGQNIKCPKCNTVQPVTEPKADDPYYHLYTSSRGQALAKPTGPSLTTEQVLAQSTLKETEREKVEGVLASDERLLWVGRPDPKIAFGRGWIFAAVWFFGAFMLLIVIIILNVAVADLSIMVTLGLLAVQLVLVGLGVATPYYKRWLAEKQFYTVSDKRATIWGCDKFGKPTPPAHYEPATLHGFYFQAAPYWGEGVGDLIFGSRAVTRGRGRNVMNVIYAWGFFMLRDAKDVEKIIRETLVDPLLDKAYS